VKKWAIRLGLTFRYQSRQIVRLSAVARSRPGESGIVRGVSVIQRDQLLGNVLLPVGTVVYRLEMSDHAIAEVPEEELVS